MKEKEMIGKGKLDENGRRLTSLSDDDCRKLIENCDEHLRPIVVTALNSGMRVSEILNLRWESVDLKQGFILLDHTDAINSKRREIPINLTLKQCLSELLSGTKERPRRIDMPYVFGDPVTGKPYENMKESFASACKRAGIEGFRFHDLRNTFANLLVKDGVSLFTMKELLGHKNP